MLQVAKAAVDELARTARRAGGEVPLLDECDRQPTADGVERDAATGHSAADDEHVERLLGQLSQLAFARVPRRRPPGEPDSEGGRTHWSPREAWASFASISRWAARIAFAFW